MKKVLKNPSGFTLVELMVVVAIIGILSAIAVPNFKKYQAKSKQSEAKIQLAAIYNAEVGTQADYDTFGTCLSLMGYEQSPRGYYIVGFSAGFNAVKYTGCTAGNIAAAGAAAGPLDRAIRPIAQLAGVTASKTATITVPGSVASELLFQAAAEASISSTAGLIDKWRINQTKQLTNVTVGY